MPFAVIQCHKEFRKFNENREFNEISDGLLSLNSLISLNSLKISRLSSFVFRLFFITLRYETICCTFEGLGADATQVYLARIFGVARRIVHVVVHLEAELHLHHRLQYQGQGRGAAYRGAVCCGG